MNKHSKTDSNAPIIKRSIAALATIAFAGGVGITAAPQPAQAWDFLDYLRHKIHRDHGRHGHHGHNRGGHYEPPPKQHYYETHAHRDTHRYNHPRVWHRHPEYHGGESSHEHPHHGLRHYMRKPYR